MNLYVSRTRRVALLTPYVKFALRWGWFTPLTMLVAVVSTLMLPDIPTSSAYQATLHIQAPLPSGFGSSEGQDRSALFYSDLFVNPTTLGLVLAKHSDMQLSDLQSQVSAAPVDGANVVELSATGSTPTGATNLVNEVYEAITTEINLHRSSLVSRLIDDLNRELIKSRSDAQSSYQILQVLQATHLTYTSAFLQLAGLYREQQDRAASISKQILALQEQVSQANSILRLTSTIPAITTIEGNPATQTQRLILAPLIGLMMGLGGMLVAKQFSSRIPLQSKKRGRLLPRVSAVIPSLPRLKAYPLQTLRQESPCLSLFRHLRYRASEHEHPLHVLTVTSAGNNEGKSTVAAGLALAAAQNGLKTLLVDAHSQRPMLHHWFGGHNAPGMLDTMRSFAQGTPVPALVLFPPWDNLCLLPIGAETPAQENPLDLASIRQLITFLRSQADMIIFDGPPLLGDANTENLVQFSDITLLVVDIHKSHSKSVIEAERLLSLISAPSVTVLNQVSGNISGLE